MPTVRRTRSLRPALQSACALAWCGLIALGTARAQPTGVDEAPGQVAPVIAGPQVPVARLGNVQDGIAPLGPLPATAVQPGADALATVAPPVVPPPPVDPSPPLALPQLPLPTIAVPPAAPPPAVLPSTAVPMVAPPGLAAPVLAAPAQTVPSSAPPPVAEPPPSAAPVPSQLPVPVRIDSPRVIDTARLAGADKVVSLFGVVGLAGEAAQGLQSFLASSGNRITCQAQTNADFVCLLPDGTDVAAAALVNGAARARDDAPVAYREQEAAAQAARRGLWSSLPPSPVAVKHPTFKDTATLVAGSQSLVLDGLQGLGAPYVAQLQAYIAANGDMLICQPQVAAEDFICVLNDGTDIAKVALVNGAALVAPDAPDSYRLQQRDALNHQRGYWQHAAPDAVAAATATVERPVALVAGDDGADGIAYVGGAPTAVIEGETVFLVFAGVLGWGYYDHWHHWHGAPDRYRTHLDHFHPEGHGLRGFDRDAAWHREGVHPGGGPPGGMHPTAAPAVAGYPGFVPGGNPGLHPGFAPGPSPGGSPGAHSGIAPGGPAGAGQGGRPGFAAGTPPGAGPGGHPGFATGATPGGAPGGHPGFATAGVAAPGVGYIRPSIPAGSFNPGGLQQTIRNAPTTPTAHSPPPPPGGKQHR